MDCKTTSTKPKRRRLGFTLIELVVSSGLASLIGVAIGNFVSYSARSLVSFTNSVSLDRSSRNALDVMSREIRQTRRLTSTSNTSVTFEDADGGTLEFAYLPVQQKLVRMKNGVVDPNPLLTECETLSFSIFQRNPIGGTYGAYPTAMAATCKMVQVSWVCSREIFGTRHNSMSAQSAKIVIRKQ
jgi:type II secretory pathway pseudopilin PulG